LAGAAGLKAAASSRKVVLEEVLAGYSRERLKELFRAVGLDDSGKENLSARHASSYVRTAAAKRAC
jgi:hypothetical protein